MENFPMFLITVISYDVISYDASLKRFAFHVRISVPRQPSKHVQSNIKHARELTSPSKAIEEQFYDAYPPCQNQGVSRCIAA